MIAKRRGGATSFICISSSFLGGGLENAENEVELIQLTTLLGLPRKTASSLASFRGGTDSRTEDAHLKRRRRWGKLIKLLTQPRLPNRPITDTWLGRRHASFRIQTAVPKLFWRHNDITPIRCLNLCCAGRTDYKLLQEMLQVSRLPLSKCDPKEATLSAIGATDAE